MSVSSTVTRPSAQSVRAPRAGRIVSALGALALLGALNLDWFTVRGPGPGGMITVDALRFYSRTDLALVAAGVLALAACWRHPSRWSPLLRLGAGALALAIVGRAFLRYDPAIGAQNGNVNATANAVGGALDLVTVSPARLGKAARSARALLVSSPVVALPLVAMTWPIYTLAPGGGTDGSGPGGLHIAARHGIDWGSEFVFTYGPLSFLTFARSYYAVQTVLSVLYVALVHWALVAGVLAVGRRAFGLVAGVVVAFALGAVFANTTPDDPTSTALTAAAFLGAIALLRRPPTGRDLTAALVAAGGLAGLAALVKPNTGVTIIALGAVVAVAAPREGRLRGLVLYGGAALVTFLVLWFLAGQTLDGILPYARNSSQILSGYAEAGASEEAERAWEYWAVPVLALLAFGGAGWATRSWALLPRLGAFACLALFVFGWFKGGFVRHDGHALHFFASMTVAALAFAAPANRVPSLLGTVAAVAAFAASAFTTGLLVPGDLVRPVISTRDALYHLSLLLPARGEAFREGERANLRSFYGIDDVTLAGLRGHDVHLEPQEASAAWAYPQLDWRPMPVFQTNFAFTSRLDAVNAEFARSDAAPTRVLRADEGVQPFESPEYFMTLYCRYDEVLTRPEVPGSRFAWQTLARGPSRCGAPRPLATRAATTERPIAVPRARRDELVFARIAGLELSLTEKLLKSAFKVPEQRFVRVGEESGRLLVADKARSSLVLSIPAAYDYSSAFTASLDARTMTVEIIDYESERPPPRAIRVDFFAVPLSRPARANG